MTHVFRHAVASFDPTAEGVLLWTRLSGGGDAAEWVLARDAELRDLVTTGVETTGPEQDRTVVAEVVGLDPETTYWYRFTCGGDLSPIGRTRTLPRASTQRFRVGLVCCARYSVAPLGVYRALAQREVDLVLHLGDYMYEDDGSAGPRQHRPPHTAVTLADYRERLAQLREDPDLQALHLRHPMTTIWDDHDLSDNAWRDGAKKHDPAIHGSWAARVRAAAQARQEWLPGRLQDRDDPLVVWRSLAIGDLAQLILLDTRLTGRDRQAGDAGTKDRHDPTRSLLGDDQRQWLQAELAELAKPWAVIASGVVINELCLPMPVAKRLNALLPNGYADLDGELMHDDQWDGYPAERARLVGWLAERGRSGGRTVLLSGDVHSSWAFEGPCDPSTGEPVAVEFTVPAVSSAAMGRAQFPAAWRLLDRAARKMEHVRWADVTERGYALLDITPGSVRAEWWHVHPYDRDPAAGAQLAASFAVGRDDWPPRLHPVEEPGVDPVRAPLPQPLPPRPADLPRLRRRRRARLAGKATASAASLLVLPVAILGRRWRSRGRQRRRSLSGHG